METIYVKINPQAGQFWDPSNKKQKMLVGKEIVEVQVTATIQNGLSAGALSISSKSEFDRQEAAKTEKPVSEPVIEVKPVAEESKPTTKTSSSKK